jgi:hypothetical protein
MALGIALVLVSIVASVVRSIPRIFWLRVVTGTGMMLLIWLTTGIIALAAAAIVAAVLVIELTWEYFHHWRLAVTPASEVQKN